MAKKFVVPPSFVLVRAGRTSLLIKEEFKDLLLQEGIENIEDFLAKKAESLRFVSGRASHPSVPIDGGPRVVVRRYSHGGILRNLTRDLFLFGTRSFHELAYTEAVRSCSIPTVEPIAAIHQPACFPFYRAYLLSREVPNSKDLIEIFKDMIARPSIQTKRRLIRSAALVLRKFHEAGFFHGDLQLKNILVANKEVLLIDFDRSYRKRTLSDEEKLANILRLNRSTEKWTRKGLPITRHDCLRFFSIYAGEDKEIRRLMRRVVRTRSLGNVIHRIGWKLERRKH
jgi:3-deoxy-D-manno-octulosonic acid kinase